MITTIFTGKSDSLTLDPVSEGVQESIYPIIHEINITDGSEFLDDAIRMHEQPFHAVIEYED